MSIDAVIDRARRGGGFGKRQRFTLARSRAIQKLRDFALASPHYYVLELIQAAVASGATVISFDFSDEEATFSWLGGNIRREELAHLFDFLFAAKGKLELGHLRELALGINALMFFEPDEIVIESGDGTPKGTSRLVITDRGETVDIGEADTPLAGTLISARGLNRKLATKRGFEAAGEASAIETRCLAAPVPIIVNDVAPFGFARMRIPKLWFAQDAEKFDEGDMYGVVSAARHKGSSRVHLLTYGVLLETVALPSEQDVVIEGVVNFDRLRKTADHSAAVRDTVFSEMLERLHPYVKRSLKESTPTIHDLVWASGERISPERIRPLMRELSRVAVISPANASGEQLKKAQRAAVLLEAQLMVCPPRALDALRRVAGSDVDVIELDLSEAAQRFYKVPLAPTPPEPWLVSAVDLPAAPIKDLRRAADFFAPGGAISASLYAPMNPPDPSAAWGEILISGRVVWAGSIPSPHRGLWVRVNAPSVSPQRFATWAGAPAFMASLLEHHDAIAGDMERRASAALLRRASQTTGDSADAMPGAALLLSQAAAHALLRLRRTDSFDIQVELTALKAPKHLMDAPVVRTVTGSPRSVRDIIDSMNQNHGFVYGTLPSVPADTTGLREHDILDLDPNSEKILQGLVGESAYVRIDAREVLAEANGLQCRDLALGLRDYPEFPLLVEGADPSDWPETSRRAALVSLVRQLLNVFTGQDPQPPTNPLAFPAWEENRRHAARHLQWFVGKRLRQDAGANLHGLGLLPLFLDRAGGTHAARAVMDALGSARGLTLEYGGAFGREALGQLTAAVMNTRPSAARVPHALVVSPFLARVLAPARPRLPFDFDLVEGSDTSDPALSIAVNVQTETFSGRIGFSALDDSSPARVIVVMPRGTRALLNDVAEGLGVSGWLRVRGEQLDPTSLAAAAAPVLQDAVDRLIQMAIGHVIAQPQPAVEATLLAMAGRHLVLTADPTGVVTSGTINLSAQKILDLPLFALADDQRACGWDLVREFCAFGVAAFDDPARKTVTRSFLNNDPPEHLRLWVEEHLHDGRVQRPGTTRVAWAGSTLKPPLHSSPECAALGARIEAQLERLRPDPEQPTVIQIATPEDYRREATKDWLEELDKAGPDVFAYMHHRALTPGHPPLVLLHRDHWLIAEALAEPANPTPLAWLLLAVYAFINAQRDPVTNAHEQIFQQRIFESLNASPTSQGAT